MKKTTTKRNKAKSSSRQPTRVVRRTSVPYKCMGCEDITRHYRKPNKCDICGDDELVKCA